MSSPEYILSYPLQSKTTTPGTMSSFYDISDETQAILDTTGFRMVASDIERQWECSSRWCASGNVPVMSHFFEIVLRQLLMVCSWRLYYDIRQLDDERDLRSLQQQQNTQDNQQLGQDVPKSGWDETPEQTQQRLRLSQGWCKLLQVLWRKAQQKGWDYQQFHKKYLPDIQIRQLEDTRQKLKHRLEQLHIRLRMGRQQLEGAQRTLKAWESLQWQGDQHHPWQPLDQQKEYRRHTEELLILACQVMTGIPENDTLVGDLVDGIKYADASGVSIEKAASYLSTDHLNHIIRALETERIEGDFTLAAETLRNLTKQRSLQNLNVVRILKSVKGDARSVWSLTELPEPLKELFHIPFQELYEELKQ